MTPAEKTLRDRHAALVAHSPLSITSFGVPEMGYALALLDEARAAMEVASGAIEHALLNVRSLTGGDERRLTMALAALKKARGQ